MRIALSCSGRDIDVVLQFEESGAQKRCLGLLRPKPLGQSRQTGVNAVEVVLFMPRAVEGVGDYRIDQLVKRVMRAGIERPSSGALGKLMLQTSHGELRVRGSQDRVVVSSTQFYRVILRITFIAAERADIIDVQLLSLPGQQTFFELLGEAVGIGSGAEGLLGNYAGCLVVSMAVTIRAAEAGHDNIWTEGANDAHHVGQNHVVAVPLLKSFVRILGKSEIGDTSEALLHAVIPIRRSQFEGTQDAKHIG